MNAPAEIVQVIKSLPDATLGYKSYTLGSFKFRRDEYFAHIAWTTRDGRPMSHTLDISNYLRALMRDVGWGFFYGWVNFDNVFGTVNKYTSVDMYAGSYNGTMKESGVDLMENFPPPRKSAIPSRKCSTTGPMPVSTRSPRRRKPARRMAAKMATTPPR
jgi:hypothetical protein